jgi:tRNA modification GTPase
LVVRELFRPLSGKPLPEQPAPGTHRLGVLGEGLADEVVVAVKETSPVPLVEITGHGGREVVRLLLESLTHRGVRVVSWPELLARTAGPLQAAAAVALAAAPTGRTAAILLDQHAGAFARALDAILSGDDSAAGRCKQGDAGPQWPLAEFYDATAGASAGGPAGGAPRGVGQPPPAATFPPPSYLFTPAAGRLLDRLAGRAALGRRLTSPWRVVVAGPPNVGKSSLVNALAGYQRSAVSPMPGTTRDVVTTTLAIDGWPVEVADTAGLRESSEALESTGVGLAQRSIADADLCLWLLDASMAPAWPEARAANLRLVVNKCDLPPAWDLSLAGDAPRVSATTGAGVAELCATLGRWLVPDAPVAGEPVPFSAGVAGAVEGAAALWRGGKPAEARERLRRLRDTGT